MRLEKTISTMTKKNKTSWLLLKSDWQLYLIFLPVLIYYIVFRYTPMVSSIIIAFKDYDIYKGILASSWCGFENFITFFKSAYFFRTIKNTLGINIYGLLIGFPMPIILALFLNEVKINWYKRTVQTVSYMTNFVSTVVVASMVISFLSMGGLINNIIASLGFAKIAFLSTPNYFWGIFTGIGIWQTTGYSAILYLAALTTIDQTLYEAAAIDGCGRWKKMWHITLPGLSLTIITLLLLKLGHLLDVGYELIILIYSPNIYEASDVINTYVYRMGIVNANYSFATAVGLFQSVIGLILVVTANSLSRKCSEVSIW